MGNMLVSTGKPSRPEPGRVAHTTESLMFRTGSPGGTLFWVFFDEQFNAWMRWPDYFAKYGPGVPKGDTVNPKCFAEGVDGKMSYFDSISTGGAERVAIFADAMKALEQLLPVAGIYDFSWVGEQARAEPGSDRPLIVDVGASKGHILRMFLEENPDIPPGRCVIEDRADVIEEAAKSSTGDPILSRVQKVATDFCKDQPVKGALVYYLRQVIHDYSDDVCIGILRHIAGAMGDDARARVFICEQILSDTPAPIPYTMDMLMLNLGSKERTEGNFQALAKAAGMRVVKFHKGRDTSVGVVECAKAPVTSV